jgi:hypothetical protein
LLEAVCEGRRYAGVGVDQAAFQHFVKGTEPGCDVSVEVRTDSWRPETTKYLHSLWKVQRLLTAAHRPGAGMAFEENNDDIEEDMLQASHSFKKVLDGVSGSNAHHSRKLMEKALGSDIQSLNHPSREAAQEVLSRIKQKFTFYHGDKCLVKHHGGQACGDSVMRLGATGCSGEEKNHMCSFTELYMCPKCGASFRFPRYRSVPKLLQTKMGRCGEFSDVAASVFTMLGYDSRLVVDYTDHVWVELNLPDKHGVTRFTHADPSEGILDQPYLYEDNWKKRLTFVFAHTPDSVEDRDGVYWHKEKHEELVKNRGMSDDELQEKVFDANIRLQQSSQATLEEDDDQDDTTSPHPSHQVRSLQAMSNELQATADFLEWRLDTSQ